MKQFRIVTKNFKSEWQDCKNWSIYDMEQFKVLGSYYIEWR